MFGSIDSIKNYLERYVAKKIKTVSDKLGLSILNNYEFRICLDIALHMMSKINFLFQLNRYAVLEEELKLEDADGSRDDSRAREGMDNHVVA